ncbi:type II secretion system protein [Acaryochloris marina]|uniref:type II secretion system protein n=1 Tax=Acaryochloris marina TaxID=155978 RepID=UPI001BAFFABA|nr:type II secretion system protein [Acaryochloris marina]QUY42781.1 type II secretion system protein [Acaryochloris marina S15]
MPRQSSFNHPREAGFTLVEVLVGLVIIASFIGTAMQAFVAATVFRVKGKELSEATTWIQEDLERVRYESNRLDYAGSSYNIVLDACQGRTKTTGYADRLLDEINGLDNISPQFTNKTSAIGNRAYTVARIHTLPTSAPFNVLKLEYRVVSADYSPSEIIEGKFIPIAITQAKIIPDASLACP